jgi:uncharacterized 2Fe-2S/4Fe-4S cluster protein (DUF4445 family)
VVRKDSDNRIIERNPATTCAMSRSKSRTCTSRWAISTGCSSRLSRLGHSGIRADAPICCQVQTILRKGHWKVTAAIHDDGTGRGAELVALYPGLKNEAYGIACDIGSTTIAMHLVSLLSGRTLASSGAFPIRRSALAKI